MTARGRRVAKSLMKKYRDFLKSQEIPPIPVKPMEIEVKQIPAEGGKEGKPEEAKIEGLEVPAYPRMIRIGEIKTEEERARKAFTYPLIPAKPSKAEPVFAYTRIFWDAETGKYIYQMVEPELTKELENILIKIRELLEQKLDVDFTKLKKFEAKEYLDRQVDELIKYFGFKTSPEENLILHYYVERDFIGLGEIEALMRDSQIEDISCDGVGIPLYIFHRDAELGSVVTNIVFPDPDKLDSFLVRLSQLCGKSISVASPLVDATLPDGSRLQATLATDIARRGSNFTIRKFSREPLTPIHLLNYGTMDIRTLAYLWFIVDIGRSMLICGGTATGKTSFLNVLSLFIRPERKIVSIEDTAEIQLPHPHWVPAIARTPIATIGGKEVDLFALLKESMRQRPDYIIVGEVRGNEAYILFQQIASIPGGEKVLVLNDGNLKTISIKEIKNNKSYKVPTIDPLTGKVKIMPLKARIEHSPVKELYRITTETGREIITTSSHSVFTYSDKIEPIQVSELKQNDSIIIPARLPCGYNDMGYLNLIELLPDIRVYSPKLIKKASRKLGFATASKIVGFTTISNYYGVNNCALPVIKFKALMKKANIDYDLGEIKVRFERGGSPLSPGKLEITPELLRLLGYYISEGSTDKAYRNNSIRLYNKNKKILEDMRRCILKVTGKKPRERKVYGYGESIELTFNHKTIFEMLKRFCGCKSNERKVPYFIFGLSKEKISHFLSALYSGDGCLGEKFYYYTTSKELANDVSNLLLIFGIVAHIKKRKRENRKNYDYEINFCRITEKSEFLKFVKPMGKKVELKGKGRYNPKIKNDIYLDKIKVIEKINLEKVKPVYDISIPGTENFIGGFGGVMLHNTGHPSLATIHAENMPKLVDRLTTQPISLPPTLVSSLDLIVFLTGMKYKGRFVRRVNEVLEMIRFDQKTNEPVVNTLFKWNPVTDKFDVVGKSVLLKKISDATGMPEKEINDELKRRMIVLNWMKEQKISDYRDVYKIVTHYYTNPKEVMDAVMR